MCPTRWCVTVVRPVSFGRGAVATSTFRAQALAAPLSIPSQQFEGCCDMRILFECRGVKPDTGGTAYFVASLVQGFLESFPDDRLIVNVAPGSSAAYGKLLPGVEIVEDATVARNLRVQKRLGRSVRYPLSAARRIHPALTRWFEGPRRSWVRSCEAGADVAFYPSSHYPLVHRIPTVMTVHDFRKFEFAPDLDRRS